MPAPHPTTSPAGTVSGSLQAQRFRGELLSNSDRAGKSHRTGKPQRRHTKRSVFVHAGHDIEGNQGSGVGHTAKNSGSSGRRGTTRFTGYTGDPIPGRVSQSAGNEHG